MKFLVLIETEVEVDPSEGKDREFRGKEIAIQLVKNDLNGSPANSFSYYVGDAEIMEDE